MRIAAWIAAAILMTPAVLRADGGKVVSSERQGDLQITVFLAPTPPRAGTLDVSVLTQSAETGEIVEPRRVLVRFQPAGSKEPPLTRRATREQATNKLLRAAAIELPHAGAWELTVEVQTVDGESHRSGFVVTAGKPLPRLFELGGWLLWPLVPVGLFLVREARRMRRVRCADRGVGFASRVTTG